MNNKKIHILQKAAMFGLDARIALAIFGALSVITGASLYNVIQHAKAVSFLTELNEMGKAWEAHYIDTGVDLPRVTEDSSSSNFYVLQNKYLAEDDGSYGWKGPYLPYKVQAYYLTNSKNYGIHLMTLENNEDWTYWLNGLCQAGEACSLWSYMSGVTDAALVRKVDILVDGVAGPGEGNFRFVCPTTCLIHFKQAPIKNPNG